MDRLLLIVQLLFELNPVVSCLNTTAFYLGRAHGDFNNCKDVTLYPTTVDLLVKCHLAMPTHFAVAPTLSGNWMYDDPTRCVLAETRI